MQRRQGRLRLAESGPSAAQGAGLLPKVPQPAKPATYQPTFKTASYNVATSSLPKIPTHGTGGVGNTSTTTATTFLTGLTQQAWANKQTKPKVRLLSTMWVCKLTACLRFHA